MSAAAPVPRVSAPHYPPSTSASHSSSSSSFSSSSSSSSTTTSTASTTSVPSLSSTSSSITTTTVRSSSVPSSSSSSSAVEGDSSSSSSSSSYIPIRDAAVKLHSSLSNSNYSVVRLGVGIADSLGQTALSLVPEPIANKVQAISSPLLDAADTQLENAYNRLQPVAATVSQRVQAVTGKFNRTVSKQVVTAQQYFVPEAWFARVDEVMRQQTGGKKARLVLDPADLLPLLQSFYIVASHQFLSLARRGQQSQQEFVDALKAAMEGQWTESLRKPAVTFFAKAKDVYERAGLRARDITTTILLDRVKPLLGPEWEKEVLLSYQTGDATTSQLIYVTSLHLFKQLQQKVRDKKAAAQEVQQEFLQGMQQKLGAVYNQGLENSLKELIAAWTSQAEKQSRSLQSGVWERYQYLLLSAQNLFDRVLPPVVNGEEDVSEEEKEEAAEGPITLRDLASHVIDRVGERGVVSNVTTASSNSVKESVSLAGHVATQGVNLAQSVASQAVQTAQSVVRPVVTPVVARVSPIVQPIVQPYMDRAMPVVDAVNKQLSSRQQQISAQLQASLQAVHSRIESIQQYINALAAQTRQKVITTANDTKTSLSATATSAATTIHSSLPAPIASRLTDLQVRMTAAVQYASQLRHNNQLQQQLAQLSLSYAEVVRAIVTEQLHALSENLNAEKLGQLAEDAKVAVGQLILFTKKQLALEKGEDETEVREEDGVVAGHGDARVATARKGKDEEKSNAREVI